LTSLAQDTDLGPPVYAFATALASERGEVVYSMVVRLIKLYSDQLKQAQTVCKKAQSVYIEGMSQHNPYTIQCPECATRQTVELLDSINVQSDPKLKDALFQNKLNQVCCESCGFEFRVDKKLLYNDGANHLMVLLLPTPFELRDEAEEEFHESVQSLLSVLPDDLRAPHLYLAIDRVELIERVFMHESGIDARVGEYMKYIIYSKNLEAINPREKVLLFNREDSDEERLIFVVQDAQSKTLEGTVEFKTEACKAIQETFEEDDHAGMIMELFPGPYISARALLIDQDEKAKKEPESEASDSATTPRF